MSTKKTDSQLGLARKIHWKHFDGPGTPRSEPYKAGALAKLHKLTGEAEKLSAIPYAYSTAEADAWMAGADAAPIIYKMHLLREREAAKMEVAQ